MGSAGDHRVRYPKDHDTTAKCRCGGHSASDVKKNPHHHATRERLAHRAGRLLKSKSRAPAAPME